MSTLEVFLNRPNPEPCKVAVASRVSIGVHELGQRATNPSCALLRWVEEFPRPQEARIYARQGKENRSGHASLGGDDGDLLRIREHYRQRSMCASAFPAVLETVQARYLRCYRVDLGVNL